MINFSSKLLSGYDTIKGSSKLSFTTNFFTILLYAGDSFIYQKDLRRCQLRITYTILYHVELRINEIRSITKKEILDTIKAAQFSVVHYKTKQPHIHILSDQAVEDLKSLNTEFEIVFEKYKFNFLFGKYKPVDEKTLIRTINKDLEHTCKMNSMPYNIKYHSFRINKITSLLKNTTVQNAAEIIAHKDTKSTMSYKRYALTRNEIKELLNKIDEKES